MYHGKKPGWKLFKCSAVVHKHTWLVQKRLQRLLARLVSDINICMYFEAPRTLNRTVNCLARHGCCHYVELIGKCRASLMQSQIWESCHSASSISGRTMYTYIHPNREWLCYWCWLKSIQCKLAQLCSHDVMLSWDAGTCIDILNHMCVLYWSIALWHSS